MSILKFSRRKLNKKNMIKFVIAIALIVVIITLVLLYVLNFSFRNFVDIKILHKEISEKNLYSIELDTDSAGSQYAYDKFVVVLNKGTLTNYSYGANKVSELEVNISNPEFASNNRFLAVYEKEGKDIYLISGSNILWQAKVDGSISKVKINKNGYVSIIVSKTSYKSIVITYDAKGKELFKTYLSSTVAVDTDISEDNKYLSIAEVDFSGTLAKSMIKTISIEEAKEEKENPVINTFSSEVDELILKIKYQNKNNLACFFNNKIEIINAINNEKIETIELEQYIYGDIEVKNSIVFLENKTTGIFSTEAIVKIFNAENKSTSSYTLENSIKELYLSNEKIAINTGSEIHFIGKNGWLIKKYNSSSEINNVLLGDSIAAIIYKDRIDIIDL